jgi:hypothetical protein
MTARSHTRSRRKAVKRARARTMRYVERAERRERLGKQAR